MRLGTADVLVRAKTDKFDKDIDKSGKKVKSFGQKSKKELAGLTSSFASLAGPAGVGALTASLTGSVIVGAKFESQMATVRGIMRASEKDFKLLSDAAKKMGATTEWSATQSGEALEFIALAGWSVSKSIEGLPGMLDAATAAGANLGETSDILTDTLTAMGLGIEDMDRLTDVMIGTTVRANTSFLQMGEALKESAPYAKAYGFEIEEVAALLGVVADAGIKGSDAGTGLKNTWINNAKAAKLLGTEATDLIGTLRAANKAQWDTNQFAKVYGKIAGKTVLNIAAQIDKYEALAETLHDVSGETKELADIKLDTLIGDWKLLKSAVEGLGGVIYEEIVDPLRAATSATATFVTDLSLSWQAVKLNLSGMIDFKTALLDGAAAVKLFNEEMGPEKTRLAYLERIIASGKYTWQVEKEAEALRTLIAIQEKAVEADKLEVVKFEDVPAIEDVDKPAKIDTSWIKSMQAQEKFALEMAEKEQERLNAKYELEKEINAKVHDELLSDTEFRIQELDKQFLAADSFMKDKAMLDEWYVKHYEEIMEVGKQKEIETIDEKKQAYMDLYNNFGILTQEAYDQIYESYVKDRDDFIALTGDKEVAHQMFAERLTALNDEMEGIGGERLDAQKDFNAQYAAMGKSTFDVEREQLTQQTEAWRKYGFDKEKNVELTADKLKKINEAETKQRINSIQSVASSMADGFKMISEMGGKHSKEAFAMYKAFKITETIISTYSGAMKAYEALASIPYVGPALGVAAAAAVTAFGMAQVSAINSAQPPSYDLGGISEAKGIYQTGDIAEAHIPIPSGGKIPVEMKSDNQISPKPMIVNIHEAPGTQTRVEQSEDGQSLEIIIEQVEQAMTGRMERGSGMAPFMDGRYGRAY